MVCAPEARQEIARALGVRASVTPPTWIAHTYSCRYRYPNGEFVLTVKELSSWPQTLAYFATLGREQGRTGYRTQPGPGIVPDGQRFDGGPQGLEDPHCRHLGSSRPIRQAADQQGGRGSDSGRRDSRLLVRGLRLAQKPQKVTAPESTRAGQPIAPGELAGGTVMTSPRHISSEDPSPHVTNRGAGCAATAAPGAGSGRRCTTPESCHRARPRSASSGHTPSGSGSCSSGRPGWSAGSESPG